MRRRNVVDTILGNFMHDIEEWQSTIEGTPTARHMKELEKIYDDKIESLDMEYIGFIPDEELLELQEEKAKDLGDMLR